MRRTVFIGLGVLSLISCASFNGSDQETMGHGIVRGTLGAQPGEEPRSALVSHPDGRIVSGQVTALEGGAYVIQQGEGSEVRLALDENTRIDRPAHVGDKIRVFLDDRGRAVVIRNVDKDE
jgi:hypothetical protein